MDSTLRRITVLSGGMGGAKFLRGLLHGIREGLLPGVASDAEVTVVANTADDIWVHGLKVCPDLDTVMYTLGDGIDPERGWGRRDESWSVKEELAAYGVEPTWFGLGDRDVATHLVRTQMLDAGYPLSEVTEALCRRWAPGRPAAADDRRPGRDPHRGRRPRRRPAAAGWCTSRSTGSGCAPRCPPRRSSWSGSTTPPRHPASSTRSPTPTWSCCRRPTRSSRSARSSACRACARRSSPPRPRSSASPPSSAASTCAAWPSSCSPRSASRSAPRGSGCTTAPARPAACSTAGWSTAGTPATWTRLHQAGLAAAAVPLLMTDDAATAAMAAAAIDLVRTP